MGKKINIIGQRFGKWTVLDQSPQRGAGGTIKWICKCDCGTIKNVDGTSLRNGKSTNCGCENKKRLAKLKSQNLIGQKFDKLTVIKKSIERDSNNRILWECQCDCGNICLKTTTYLHRSDFFHSCGCYGKEQIVSLNKKDLVGKRFGKLIVLEQTDKRQNDNILWKCQCDCGNIVYVRTNSLTTGNTRSCGCINYSIGEKNIKDILEKNNIKYCTQYTEPSLSLKKFDFAILNNQKKIIRLIEFDGEQHYTDIQGLWNSKETLEGIQKRDQEKNNWAKEHNIPLVRIPYWERDNITLDILLGDKYLIM